LSAPLPPTGLAPVEANAEKRGCATNTSFFHHRRKAGGIGNIIQQIADAPFVTK